MIRPLRYVPLFESVAVTFTWGNERLPDYMCGGGAFYRPTPACKPLMDSIMQQVQHLSRQQQGGGENNG